MALFEVRRLVVFEERAIVDATSEDDARKKAWEDDVEDVIDADFRYVVEEGSDDWEINKIG